MTVVDVVEVVDEVVAVAPAFGSFFVILMLTMPTGSVGVPSPEAGLSASMDWATGRPEITRPKRV